jgi:GH18 family chitinase
MKKRFISLFSFLVFLSMSSCDSGEKVNSSNESNTKDSFKVIGYYLPMPRGSMSVSSIPYEYLTSINYSFAIPTNDSTGNLVPLQSPMHDPDTLHALVKTAHSHGVEIFVSIGGFGVGDGPGIDTRFEVLANRKETRTNFAHSCMNLIREFNLDGIDMDWEFPDPEEPSISNFVSLMKELKDSLKPAGKKLTAAIESHRLPYTYGIDNEVFNLVDWLNIMVYDGEEIGWHRPNLQTSHSPYWLAVESLDYWLDKRGLPKEKTILGVPFYGKGVNRSYYNYRKLLAMGANPEADVFDSIHYNGIKTMKRKALLAKKRAAGVMIWEIAGDTTGQYSLLKAIHDSVE